MNDLGKLRRSVDRALWFVGLITLLVIFTPIVRWWTLAYSGPMKQPKGDILIMLSAAGDDNGGISFSSYRRARYVLLAWQTGSIKKIFVSGGGPGISNFLMAEGVPRDVIATDFRSSSTHESGLAMAQFVRSYPGRKVLLTSDYHMYRAVRVFRKCGVEIEPMPVPDASLLAQLWNGRFQVFQIMLEESAKIVYYACRGWI